MSMSVGGGGDSSRDPDAVPEMNTTPLIDVMLVLIVMLIISLPVQMHAVKLDMPQTNQPPPATPPPVVTVEIDFDGTLLWEDAQGTQTVPDMQTMEQKFSEIANLPVPPELHIKPNKLASYKYVAAVMAAAQRLGVKQMGLVGNEQFIQ